MERVSVTLAMVLVALAAAAPARAASTAAAETSTATAVTQSAATLQGVGTPQAASSSYYFEYGTTTAYGGRTPSAYFNRPYTKQNVQATVNGLDPNRIYHYRLVVDGTAFGADLDFATAALPGLPDTASNTLGGLIGATGPRPDGGGSSPTLGSPVGGSATGGAAAPVIGQQLDVSPASGSVRVQAPGAKTFAPLGGNATVPVGSTVDARRGTVNLVTASGSDGSTQSAAFRGGIFQVRQGARSGGMVDMYLRGGNFRTCARAAPRLKAARSRTVRRLWGRDRGGHFRTHGSHGVATVRGTEWVVADRCDGTLTKVAEGAVSVRDLTLHKRVLVTAGHSYFARAR
jgi:hypothetical protein